MNTQPYSHTNRGNTSVLIVDDVPINVTLIEKMLTPFHFSIRKAYDGQTALDMVAEQKPSLIILDLMMPGISGYDVIRQLRNKDETKKLPIIIVSARNSNEDIVKGFNLGANDFITKPIIVDRLHDSIKTQLDNTYGIENE